MVPLVASEHLMPPESFRPLADGDTLEELGPDEGDRTGLLVMRAWVEEGSREPLRVQIRLTTDVSRGYQRTMNVTDVDTASAAVSGWLTDMLAAQTSPE